MLEIRIGHRFVPWARNSLGKPALAGIIAVGTVLIGGALSIWPSEIKDAYSAVFSTPRGGLHLPVFLLTIGIVVWTLALFLHLWAQDATNANRLAAIRGAVSRAPNYSAVKGYPSYFDRIRDRLSDAISKQGAAEERLTNLEEAIKDTLKLVAALASEFSGADDDILYGANVMLVAKPATDQGMPFPTSILSALRFYDKEGGNPASLFAVLYLLPGLVVTSHKAELAAARSIPLLALPVPHRQKSRQGHQQALPGAPVALLSGKQSIHEDTRTMVDLCVDFTGEIRDQIREYFSEAGEGSHIRSLVSFRLGSATAPVGVLNIDCSATFLLGPVADYYHTFYALITPILRMLQAPVDEYARLLQSLSLDVRTQKLEGVADG